MRSWRSWSAVATPCGARASPTYDYSYAVGAVGSWKRPSALSKSRRKMSEHRAGPRTAAGRSLVVISAPAAGEPRPGSRGSGYHAGMAQSCRTSRPFGRKLSGCGARLRLRSPAPGARPARLFARRGRPARIAPAQLAAPARPPAPRRPPVLAPLARARPVLARPARPRPVGDRAVEGVLLYPAYSQSSLRAPPFLLRQTVAVLLDVVDRPYDPEAGKRVTADPILILQGYVSSEDREVGWGAQPSAQPHASMRRTQFQSELRLTPERSMSQ